MTANGDMPAVFRTATRREIMLARVAYQSDYLMSSVYVNLSLKTMPIHDEYLRRLKDELSDPDDGVLLNYVGPMTEGELAEAMKARDSAL